jgi:hypothetical protein
LTLTSLSIASIQAALQLQRPESWVRVQEPTRLDLGEAQVAVPAAMQQGQLGLGLPVQLVVAKRFRLRMMREEIGTGHMIVVYFR